MTALDTRLAGRPLHWWLRRFQAMPAREVVHRAWRMARHPIERALIASGQYAPVVPDDVWGTRRPLELNLPALTPQLRADADRICAGETRVLGLGWMPRPDWDAEPRAGATWPRVHGSRALASAPAGFDARLTWESNRGHDWVLLAFAWRETGDGRYAVKLRERVESWCPANPLGVGINWASAMEAAIRIHSFAAIASLLPDSRDPLMPVLARLISEHAAFVELHLSRYSSANNHLIVELSGLVVAARALGPSTRFARNVDSTLALLRDELERQVFDDGVNAEMATHYHQFVLEALVLVALVEPVRHRWLDERIAAMMEYLSAVGTDLQQGDNDDGRILPLLPIPTTTVRTSKLFATSGQVVLRGPRVAVGLDAGPFGFGSLAAHAHCDALAIALSIGGQRVLVDRGTYIYNGDRAKRDWYRSTAAHNTLQIGTREQADATGPFMWGRRPTARIERCELGDHDVVIASHDGFAPALHRRTIVRRGDAVLVRDHVDGTSEPCTTRFHFAPELTLQREGERFTILRGTEPIGWLMTNGIDARVMETPHSDVYGAEVRASTLEVTGSTLSTTIAPADTPFAVAKELAAC